MSPLAAHNGAQPPTPPSAAPSHLDDLGPDLLCAVFLKLGPSPMHLAAVPGVCKSWQQLMYEHIYRQLCEKMAPALCKAMGFTTTNVPTGGWPMLFKLLTFCPGAPDIFRPKVPGTSNDWGWWGMLAHVQAERSAFQTGSSVTQALRMKAGFEQEVVFVAGFCDHKMLGDTRDPEGCMSRGLVRNFPESLIAERTGAAAYLRESAEEQERIKKESRGERCAYCDAMLFDLSPGVIGTAGKDAPDDSTEFAILGQACANGHLIFVGLYHRWPEIPTSLKHMPASEEGRVLQTCGLRRLLASTFAVRDRVSGFNLVRRFNPLTVSEKLKRLAMRATELGLRNEQFHSGIDPSNVESPRGAEAEPSGDAPAHQELETEWTEWRELHRFGKGYKVEFRLGDFGVEVERRVESLAQEAEVLLELETVSDDEASFWDIPSETLSQLGALFQAVRNSEATMSRYLNNEQDSRVTVEQLQRLEALKLKGDRLQEGRNEMVKRRTREVEDALSRVGIRQLCHGDYRFWPDEEVVMLYTYNITRITLDEVIVQQS